MSSLALVAHRAGEPDDLEQCIRDSYAATVKLGRMAVTEAHRCGRLLIKAKDLTEHGGWLPLLERCGIPPRTAQRFMRLARKYQIRQLGAFASVEAAERALTPGASKPEAPPWEGRPDFHGVWQWWLEGAPIRPMSDAEYTAAIDEMARWVTAEEPPTG